MNKQTCTHLHTKLILIASTKLTQANVDHNTSGSNLDYPPQPLILFFFFSAVIAWVTGPRLACLFVFILAFFSSGWLWIVFSLLHHFLLLTAKHVMALYSCSCALTVVNAAAEEIWLMVLGQRLTRTQKDILVSFLWEEMKEEKHGFPLTLNIYTALTEQEKGALIWLKYCSKVFF